MKLMKILIRLVLIFSFFLFSFCVFASSETNEINIRLFSKVFSGTITKTIQGNYIVDNILYIENKERINKNYITVNNRIASDLFLYHRTQKKSFVATWDSFTILCKDKKLLFNGYKFEKLWLNFHVENKNYYLKIKCAHDEIEETSNPWSLFDFKEKDVYINNDLQPYSLSSQYGIIETEQIDESFLKPNPAIQPTFVDINFLQIQTINNLIKSLNILWVDTKNLFIDSQEFNFYKQWLKKYSLYTNKQVFVDSFQDSITLKDLWIANDIVKWLSKRLLCEYKWLVNCSWIKLQFSKKWKYNFYTLWWIIDNVFLEKGISDIFISLYTETKKLQWWFDDIWNPWVKKLIDNFMEKTYWKIDDINDLTDYSIWYGLQTRIDNIFVLKNKIKESKDKKMNILGLYNFYFEINNIMKWQEKVIEIDKKRNSDELKELVEKIIIKQNIKEKKNILWDTSSLYVSDIWRKLQNDILTFFNIKDKDVIFEFICGNTDGYSIASYLKNENIKTYDDYYNVLWWLIDIAYNEMNIVQSDSEYNTYILSFNMSHIKKTPFEEYFVTNNDCVYISDSLSLALWYNTGSIIYNTNDVTYITDHSNKNNIGYKSLYPLSEMPTINDDGIYFNGKAALKVFDSHYINLWNFAKRTVEIDFTTYNANKTQVLYDEGNNIVWLNIFIKDSKIYIWWWNLFADWEGTFLTTNIESNIPYKVKLVLDTKENGISDGFRLYLDNGSGYIKKWQWWAFPLWEHYLTRIWSNTRTKYSLDCKWNNIYDKSCAWDWSIKNYFEWEIRDIKVWNTIK